ncbi:MAG: glucose-6-phosphate isomerase, partial [Candidatus Bipolaricaulota bacterium]|nr:glucose-6-phosphate isomerase [Candidatus Bipolaricaulota bacterium]
MIRTTPEPSRLPERLDQLDAADVVPRVWAGDHTVWGTHPAEIANRLGWLRAPETMREHLVSLRKFAAAVRGEGCDAVALLGMGGSSLAPETLANMSRVTDGPRLVVLDTTHPGAVRRAIDALDPARTFYIVSTKSGTTPETLALFRTFHRRAADALGKDVAGARFAAITDPGSPLVRLARDVGFRRVFLNDPTIGGRYSALSLVGLVPAALLGLDLDGLLDDARAMVG